MIPDLDCPSLMELTAFRAHGAEDALTARHLSRCSRCSALLAGLPAGVALPELGAAPARVGSGGSRREKRLVNEPSPGTLWRVTASLDADWAWVVAIIGRTPDSPDQLVVAPVVAEAEQATEADLLLDPEILGYNGFVEVANVGTILESQLLEPLGELLEPATHALSALYRSLLGSGDPPAPQWLGLPVESEDDPRLLFAAARSESLRSLWRRAPARGAAPNEPPVHLPTPESVGTLVSAHLTAGEWDRPSLLEASGADGKHLTSFLSDRLDLTDKRDIADLARVLHCLDLPWEVAEPAVRLSLLGSPGGSRHATGPSLPIAARSQPGTSDADIAADLFADQSSIDDSMQARKQQVDLYVSELRRELDALE